jgi:hypothetical protein
VVAGLAVLVLATELLYAVWRTVPAWGAQAPAPLLLAAAMLAIGGVWLFALTFNLGARRGLLVPREKLGA